MKKYLPVVLFLALLIVILYLPFLKNTFVADDDIGIALNRNIGNLAVVFSNPLNWLRPFLYYLAFTLGGGLNPLFFRLTNILAHLGATIFLYLFLLRVSTKRVAIATSALFAVHPVLTESITWISGGSYSLYGFFLMMSLMFYVYGRLDNKKSYIFYSLISFVFALFSSEKAVVLPLLLILYEFCFSKKAFFVKKNLFIFVPFFIFSLVIGGLALKALGPRLMVFTKDYYQQVTGYDPLFQIPVAISFYLQLVFFPLVLTLYHSEIITDPEYITRVVVCILFFIALIVSFRKSKPFFFGLAFFLISILPTLNPFGISSLVAERYVYLGTAGLLFSAVYSAEYLLAKLKLKRFEVVLFLIVLSLFSLRTIIRNNDWRTHESFWTSAAQTSPYSFQTHYNLATFYLRTGEYKKAIEEYNRTIVLAPRYADVYQDAGAAYHNSGDVKTALGYYLKAVELNPKLWKALQNIGGIYFQGGKLEVAKKYTLMALSVNKNEINLYINLGIIELRLGDKEKAREAFNKALLLNPQSRLAKEGLMKLEKLP